MIVLSVKTRYLLSGGNMKKIIGGILATSLLLSSASFASSNIPSDWAIDDIRELKEINVLESKIFRGYQEDISRVDFMDYAVSVYETLTGKDIKITNSKPFNDAYEKGVVKAFNIGLTEGIGNGAFGRDEPLNREQVATIFMRLLTILEVDMNQASKTVFSDDDLISSWAKESVYLAKENNIIDGVGNNKFDPAGPTNKEVAMILTKRILDEFDGKLVRDQDGNKVKADAYKNKIRIDDTVNSRKMNGYDLRLTENKENIPEDLRLATQIVSDMGTFGVIKPDGSYLIPLMYQRIQLLPKKGVYLVRLDDKMAIFDELSGKQISSFEHDSISRQSDMLDIDYLRISNDNKFGIVNTKGDLLVPSIYDSIKYNSIPGHDDDGFVVSQDGKYGLIDNKNNVLIPLKHTDIDMVTWGYTYVVLDNEYDYTDSVGDHADYIERTGGTSISRIYRYMYGNDWSYKYRYLDTIYKLPYDYVGNYSKGYAIVGEEEAYNLINVEGDKILDKNYQNVMTPSEDLIWVQENNLWKALQLDNQSVVVDGLEGVMPFSEGYAPYMKDNKWGLINKSGKVTVDAKYDYLGLVSEGYAHAKLNDKWGHISVTGSVVTDFDYIMTREFLDGVASVRTKDGWGLVNKTGNLYTKSDYYRIREPGMNAIKREHVKVFDNNYNFVNILNKDGKELFELSSNKYINPDDIRGAGPQFGNQYIYNIIGTDGLTKMFPEDNEPAKSARFTYVTDFIRYDYTTGNYRYQAYISERNFPETITNKRFDPGTQFSETDYMTTVGDGFVKYQVNSEYDAQGEQNYTRRWGLMDTYGVAITEAIYKDIKRENSNLLLLTDEDDKTHYAWIKGTPEGSFADYQALYKKFGAVYVPRESFKPAQYYDKNPVFTSEKTSAYYSNTMQMPIGDPGMNWINNPYASWYKVKKNDTKRYQVFDDMFEGTHIDVSNVGSFQSKYSSETASEMPFMHTHIIEFQENPTIQFKTWAKKGSKKGKEEYQNMSLEVMKYFSESAEDGEAIYNHLDHMFINRQDDDYGAVQTFGGTKVIVHDPGYYGVVLEFLINN